MIKVKEEHIVFLTVSTFVGTGVGATHYYGRLEHLQGGDDADVTYKMTKAEADKFNGGKKLGYRQGELSTRFSTRRKVINAAKKQFKKHFPKATVLVLGCTAVVEPQEILVGPKEFKDAVNKLAKQYEKLDWDIRADRKEIKRLEKKWEILWPRKYTYKEQ